MMNGMCVYFQLAFTRRLGIVKGIHTHKWKILAIRKDNVHNLEKLKYNID